MSAVLEPRHAAGGKEVDVNVKLAFSKKLQVVTNRIHSTQNVDEIILDVSKDICQLFEADRMTVYITSEDIPVLRFDVDLKDVFYGADPFKPKE